MLDKDLYTLHEVPASEITEDAHTIKWSNLLKACIALKPGKGKIVKFEKGKEDVARRATASLSARLRRDGVRSEYLIVAPNEENPLTLSIARLAEPSLPRLRRRRK